MPYLVRARGRCVEMRDGVKATDPVRLVGREWVEFQTLHPSVSLDFDSDVEVRITGESVRAAEPVATPHDVSAPQQHEQRKGRRKG
jgi:hypothetical protein